MIGQKKRMCADIHRFIPMSHSLFLAWSDDVDVRHEVPVIADIDIGYGEFF